ncbi:MAG: energy transducer TonB [Rhizomicrobium sp.]
MLAAAAISGAGPTGQASDIPLLSAIVLPPGVTFPKRIDTPTPTPTHVYYPPLAIRCGMTGTATVELLVAPDGSVGSAKVVSSTGYTVLDTASLNVASQFHYSPATKDGAAIPARIDVALNWKQPVVPGVSQECTLPASAFTNGTPPAGSSDTLSHELGH